MVITVLYLVLDNCFLHIVNILLTKRQRHETDNYRMLGIKIQFNSYNLLDKRHAKKFLNQDT